MEKVMLKAFTLAAAAVAPHLIAVNPKASEPKRIETFGPLERQAIKAPTEQFVARRSRNLEHKAK